ncbi:MAG TPA: RHS repeat-associated core domain-containing protein [Candidatus Sulfotelmatobacter sp.]|nr:RHS repeat-associated core domain-containing protein [Candidatus Sulfotelmatobacter sp.]
MVTITNDALNTLTYDGEGRAVTASGGLGSGSYTYDGNGLRVKKIAGSTTTVYIFSGSKVIAEYANGAAPTNPTREYIYAGGALLARIDSSGTNYYHQDHLSNRMVTNSSGGVVAEMGHFPFGESWYNATNDKLYFTTYEYDSESGNHYAMARYHMSRLGRLSSPDPLPGSTANPQSLNRYSYSVNDPANVTDPSGATPDCNTVQVKPSDKSQQASGPGPSEPSDDADGDPPPQSGCVDHTNPFGGGGFSLDGGFVGDDSGELPNGGFQIGGDDLASQIAFAFTSTGSHWVLQSCDGGVGCKNGLTEIKVYEYGNLDLLLSLGVPQSAGTQDFAPDLPPALQSKPFKLLCPVNAGSLDAYLGRKGSPIAGQGAALISAGQQFNVDPRFVVAIAGAESRFGENITRGPYNAWNWGSGGFSSWGAGITAVSHGLGTGRLYLNGRPPLTTTSSIYGRYCQGPDCANGLSNINTFLKKEQDGDPNSLRFPCK